MLNFKSLIIFFFTNSLFLFISCQNNHEDKKIKHLIDLIYSAANPFRNHELTSNVYSKKLDSLILKAKEIEKLSKENIPEEDRNEIKPHSIEGEIFASLYEGYTSYSIKEIITNGDSRVVKLEFVFDRFGSKEIWTDSAILINENGWKLDNVVYGKAEKHFKSLQNLLSNFIGEYEELKNANKK